MSFNEKRQLQQFTMYSVCAHISIKKFMLQVTKMPKQMQGKKF